MNLYITRNDAIEHDGRRRRTTAVVDRLTEEGWRVQYAPEGVILRAGGGATVVITDEGEVTSSDPIARLYVHCIYSPETYGLSPDSVA